MTAKRKHKQRNSRDNIDLFFKNVISTTLAIQRLAEMERMTGHKPPPPYDSVSLMRRLRDKVLPTFLDLEQSLKKALPEHPNVKAALNHVRQVRRVFTDF
jgi:hypothetical protein